MKTILWLGMIVMCQTAWSQRSIDSLTRVLDKQTIDTAYVDLLNQLSFEYLVQRPSEALPVINKSIAIADSINYPFGLFRATMNKGSAYWTVGLPDLALKYYLEAESIIVPDNYDNNAALYNNMGEVFKKKEQYDSAIPYFKKGLAVATLGGKRTPMITYNLGEVFLLKGNLDSAYFYYDEAYSYALLENHKRGMAYALTGLADLAMRGSAYNDGVSQLKRALSIRKEIKDNRGISLSFMRLAEAYSLLDQTNTTKQYLDSAIQVANAIGAKDLVADGLQMMSTYYKTKNDHKTALLYLDRHYLLKDSLSHTVFIANLDQMKAALLSEIQQAENQLLKEQNERVSKETEAMIYLISGISIVLLVFGLFLYQYQQRKSAINSTTTNRKIIKTLQEVSQVGVPHGFAPFLKEVLSLSAETLQVERAIYWELNSANNQLTVTAFYSANESTPDMTGYSTPKDKFKKYFEALARDKVLVVEDTRQDNHISEFDRDYLKINKIRSLMDVEIRSERTFIGVLSFEQTNSTRKWSLSDQRFASSLSNIISSAYLLEENKNLLIELLEKNQRLRDSTFSLSHNLREPLSQILGFAELHLKDRKNAEEVWKHLDKAAKQIDKVVRDLTKQLLKE